MELTKEQNCKKCNQKTEHQVWEVDKIEYWVCQGCCKIRKDNKVENT